MDELGAWLPILRDVGALGVLALAIWLMFQFLREQGRGRRRDDDGYAHVESIAWLWFLVALAAVWLGFARRGTPQEPESVAHPFDGLTVRTTWPSSTTRIECETPGLAAGPVAVVELQGEEPDPPEVTAPLLFPVLEVRCRACNSAGCSALSPNALEISERARADCNADGTINVVDVVCVGGAIFAGGY